MQVLLNLVLQYGIERYSRHDYADDTVALRGEYNYYGTTAMGLVECMESNSLKTAELRAVLDGQDRLVSLEGEANFALKQKVIDGSHTVGLLPLSAVSSRILRSAYTVLSCASP